MAEQPGSPEVQPEVSQALPLRPVAQRCSLATQMTPTSEAETGLGSGPRKRKAEESPPASPPADAPQEVTSRATATSSHSVSGGGEAEERRGQGAPPPGWAPHKSAWKRYKEASPDSEGITSSPSASASHPTSSGRQEGKPRDAGHAQGLPVTRGMGHTSARLPYSPEPSHNWYRFHLMCGAHQPSSP